MFIVGNMFKRYEYVVVMLLGVWVFFCCCFFPESEKRKCDHCTFNFFFENTQILLFLSHRNVRGFGFVVVGFFF